MKLIQIDCEGNELISVQVSSVEVAEAIVRGCATVMRCEMESRSVVGEELANWAMIDPEEDTVCEFTLTDDQPRLMRYSYRGGEILADVMARDNEHAIDKLDCGQVQAFYVQWDLLHSDLWKRGDS